MGENEHAQDEQTEACCQIAKPVEPFHDSTPAFHD
jgi:hypothetical protein